MRYEASIKDRIMDLTDQLVVDPLTGIKNRKGIDEVLSEWVIDEFLHTIILLDLDYFKNVIDSYGGEEFLILLPYTSIESALAIAERVRVKQTYSDKLCGRPVTLSAGIATYSSMAKTSKQLIEIADRVLYTAKK